MRKPLSRKITGIEICIFFFVNNYKKRTAVRFYFDSVIGDGYRLVRLIAAVVFAIFDARRYKILFFKRPNPLAFSYDVRIFIIANTALTVTAVRVEIFGRNFTCVFASSSMPVIFAIDRPFFGISVFVSTARSEKTSCRHHARRNQYSY